MVTTMAVESMVAPVADEIRRTAAQAEAERRLPNSLFSRLMDAGLFAIYTPKQFGGLELPLPDALRVVEEVSRHDGSTGWTVALGMASGLFTSVLPDESAAAVLGNGSVLIAGSPAFGVRADPVPGGYRLNGRWQYNSGAPNAHWIGCPCPIFDGDAPRMGEFGPVMVFWFVPASAVEIIDTWYVTGLRASGTQDLCVKDVFVPEAMTGGFALPSGPVAVRPSPLTRIPLFTLVGLVQAPPVILGLARRAIEEFRNLAVSKQSMFGPKLSEQVQTHVGLARAEALVQSARSYWYENVERIWDAAKAELPISMEDRAAARLASLTVTENGIAAADLLYRLAGTTAIYQSSPLERCWRDIHTAGQHMQVQDCRWETAGRVLIGADPGSPII